MFWKNNRNFLRTWYRHKHIKWFTNTAFCWLVLEYCERKLLLAGSCWRLMLECYERKILLADAGAEQSENLPELLSTRIKQSKRGKKVQWWLVDSIEMVKLWLSSETGSEMWRKYKGFQPQKITRQSNSQTSYVKEGNWRYKQRQSTDRHRHGQWKFNTTCTSQLAPSQQ